MLSSYGFILNFLQESAYSLCPVCEWPYPPWTLTAHSLSTLGREVNLARWSPLCPSLPSPHPLLIVASNLRCDPDFTWLSVSLVITNNQGQCSWAWVPAIYGYKRYDFFVWSCQWTRSRRRWRILDDDGYDDKIPTPWCWVEPVHHHLATALVM